MRSDAPKVKQLVIFLLLFLPAADEPCLIEAGRHCPLPGCLQGDWTISNCIVWGWLHSSFSKIHVQQPNWVESLQKAILGTDKSFWTAKSGSWQTCMYLIVALVTLFNFAYLVQHHQHNIVNWQNSSSGFLATSLKGLCEKKSSSIR